MIPEIAVSLVTAETLEQYLQSLTEQKIKRLGYGLTAVVFDHPTMPNVVVKAIVASDPYYLKYVDFCKAHPNNPWLPKILSGPETRLLDLPKRKGTKTQQKMIFVFLEKLTPVTASTLNRALDYAISLGDLVGDGDFSDFGPFEWTVLARQTKDKDFAELAAFLRKHSNNVDLHKENFMLRGKQVVFNDPVSPGIAQQMLA